MTSGCEIYASLSPSFHLPASDGCFTCIVDSVGALVLQVIIDEIERSYDAEQLKKNPWLHHKRDEDCSGGVMVHHLLDIQ